MISPKISDILGIINKIAPFSYAEGWDNAGLQVGDPARSVTRVAISLDPGQDAVDAALESQCQLLLTHHPLIFNPLKKISLSEPTGRIIAAALKHDLGIVALHTNFDIADGGLNDLLAQKLELGRSVPLKATGSDQLLKMAVFVPKGHEENVLESLFPFSGIIGNYRDCSFGSTGVGTFRPVEGANPYLGQVGKRETVKETRLEVLLKRADLAAAINAMIKAHPYEEPAFDLYPLLNEGKERGLGRIGRLAEPVSLKDFALVVKERLALDGLRVVGSPERVVRKVAVCGGSGMSLFREAVFKGADVFITGDVKYHEAREAEAAGICLIDAGHFGTERLMVGGLAGRLREEFDSRRYDVDIVPFLGEQEPFRHV